MSSAWKYVIAYLLIIQLAIGWVVPDTWVYYYRVPYDVFKEAPNNTVDVALDQIARQIAREGLQDYVVLLGDSVGYSGPGGPEQSIGYYMEEISRAEDDPVRVFNLALPAMQAGDMYIVLKKLQERGIATDRVVINLIYGGFVARRPGPPIVYWLGDDLARLDPDAWDRYGEALIQNREARLARTTTEKLNAFLRSHIPLLTYQPVLKQKLMGAIKPTQEVYNTLPWHEKPYLPELMKEPLYQRDFSPEPFVMTTENPQLYFLEKIMAETADHPPLIFLTPVNQELMKENVTQPGYQENLQAVDAWFAQKPAAFHNWEHVLPDHLFADHVHLTPDGYRVLAGMILENLGR